MSAPTGRRGNDDATPTDDAAMERSAGTTDVRTPPEGTAAVPAPRRAPSPAAPVPTPRPAPDVAVPAPRRAPGAAATPTAVPTAAPRPAPTSAPTATPSTATPARVRPGWVELGVAAVAYVGLLQVLDGLLDALGLAAGPWLAASSALAALGAVVAALAARVRSPEPLCLRPAPLALLPVGIGLGLLTFLVAQGLAAVVTELGVRLPAAQTDLWRFTGVGPTVALVVLVGLAVPVVEELLFRGVVVAALGRYGLVVAAAGSAVLFGAAHGLTFVVVAAVLLGAANAVMLWRVRSIWPGVAAHATFNLLSIGLTLALS